MASLPQDRELGRAIKTNMPESEMEVEGQPPFQSQLLVDHKQYVTVTSVVYISGYACTESQAEQGQGSVRETTCSSMPVVHCRLENRRMNKNIFLKFGLVS